jgi:transglutaminase-like putative cysteine protease
MAIERTTEGGPRGYRPTDGFFDEVFAPDGAPRPHAAGLVSALERIGPEQLAAAGRNRDKIILQQGIAFEHTSVEVETHAWLEALLPGGARGEPIWRGADPTNRCLAGETHVKIGHGRTYADVPPIKGVFRGSATSELEARVTKTRVDREASAGV